MLQVMNSSCSLATEIYESLGFHILQWCILISCLASIILIVSSINVIKRSLLESITKELLASLYFYLILYSLSQVFNQSVLLIFRYSANSPCDARVPRGFCIARMLGSSVVPSVVVIHISITVQRVLSSFVISLRVQAVVGRLLIAGSLIYAIVYGVLTYLPEPLEGLSAYCSSITKSSEAAVIMNIYVMFFLDVLNVASSFALWKYNYSKLEERNFDLQLTFHRRQNIYTIVHFLPVEALHTVVYVSLFVVYVLGANLRRDLTEGQYLFVNVVTNVFPYYAFLCPLTLTFLIKRGRFQRQKEVSTLIDKGNNAKDAYFKQLSLQWT